MTHEVAVEGPFGNPYRPGAGHMPPYLAGRREETSEFERLLGQTTILENLVLTGLRGLGKTVLLETFKPRARAAGWLWIGTDLSESASISEANLATRLLADLSVVTSTLSVEYSGPSFGFTMPDRRRSVTLTFEALDEIFRATPGLPMDKLKACLRIAGQALAEQGTDRVIFAYDEAQNLTDHAGNNEYPLSVLLDVFASLQRSGMRFLLVLTGLPTLPAKLVEARAYAERMFHVVTLDRLSDEDSRDAVMKPIAEMGSSVGLTSESVDSIVTESGGYPYFIQFIGREVFDVFLQQFASTGAVQGVPMGAIQRKLDTDFFAGRWTNATDRQRQLLYVIAQLRRDDGEFTIQEVAELSRQYLRKPFSPSHINQMLASLSEHGLIYKNRFGRYSFAVPLLDKFIDRTYELPGADARE